MKILTHYHHLNVQSPAVLSQPDFNAPSGVLPYMLRQLHPEAEIYTSINHFEEQNDFMRKNINIETIKLFADVDGYIIDQVFLDEYHALDGVFVNELSKLIGVKHFIIGPSFSKVPSFLQSRLLEEAILFDVSAVMYDLRQENLSDPAALQPLAKLKMHAKNRIDIIPVVRSREDMEWLIKNIPFDIVYIHPK